MNINPKQKSLFITVDYNEFVWHYINVKSESRVNNDLRVIPKNRSKAFLLQALDLFFNFLNKIYDSRLFEKNITVYTLFKLLDKDDRPKANIDWKIFQYQKHLDSNSLAFKDHLTEAFLLHLNKKHNIKKKYKKSYRFFYFITSELKSFLFKIIRKIIYKSKKEYFTNSSFFNKPYKYFDIYLDSVYLLKIENRNRLLFLSYINYIQNKDFKDFVKLFHLNNKESKKLKEDLCQLIKTLPFNN